MHNISIQIESCFHQVSKDAKECMQECVSEFVSFITSEYPSLAPHTLLCNLSHSKKIIFRI